MNRKLLIVLGVLLLFGLAWCSLMGFINSRSSTVNVTVSGDIDEVILYEEGAPASEVLRIVTNGQAAEESIRLRNAADYSFWRQMPAARYFFTMRQGDQTGRGGPVCCSTGLSGSITNLAIRGLNDWEQSTR